jgi:hyperosmotically inducible periplasmic protein
MKKPLQVAFAATLVMLSSVLAISNRVAAQGAGDAAITANVKAQLASHGETKVSDISVSTAQGVVSLSGTARSLAAKDEAQRVAAKVAGVKSVNSTLQIVDVPDATILAEIKDGFSAHGVNKAAQVTYTSVQGTVTLSGNANSPAAKDEAGDVAKKAEGVKSVVNNIVARQ